MMRFRTENTVSTLWTGLCGIAFLICAISPRSAQAQETPAVVVKDEARTCSSEFSARFIEELGLRISAELLVDPVEDGEAHWTLMMNQIDENICEVRLESGDKLSSFELVEDAERLEVVAIATRLAWIIDGMPQSVVPEPETLEDMSEEEPLVVQEQPEGLSLVRRDEPRERLEEEPEVEDSKEPELLQEFEGPPVDEQLEEPENLEGLAMGDQIRQAPRFSFDAVGGAMWVPAIDANLMMVRARAGWQPFRRVKFQVAGRLPLGSAEMKVSQVDITYRAWSVDLMSNYTRKFGERWTFNAGGGARRTIFDVTAEDRSQQNLSQEDGPQEDRPQEDRPQEDRTQEDRVPGQIDSPSAVVRQNVTSAADSEFQNALSPWSVLGSASVHYSLTQLFSLGLETTAAMSLTERTVREDGEVIADLGRLEVDIVLGLEVRF